MINWWLAFILLVLSHMPIMEYEAVMIRVYRKDLHTNSLPQDAFAGTGKGVAPPPS